MTVQTDLPYRPNVAAALFNHNGQVLVARRANHELISLTHPWQMPQGGIDATENPRTAILRELHEEIGTSHATIIGEIDEWLTYDFPPEVAKKLGNKHRGQRQRWFALRFLGTDAEIRLDADPNPEFVEWRWIALADAPSLTVPFKRAIYARVARDFARFTTPTGD